MPDALHDAWAAALGQVLAEERRQWEGMRELAAAQFRAALAEIEAKVARFEVEASRLIAGRLAELKDGDKGDKGEPGPPGELEENDLERLETRIAELVAGLELPIGPPGPAYELTAEDLTRIDGAAAAAARAVLAATELPPGEMGPPGPPGAFLEPVAWRDGAITYAGELVTLDGSTWFARVDTAKRPPGEDWHCIAHRGVDAREGEVFGVYDPARRYHKFDLVVLDGAEWRARADDPGPLPGAGWALSAAQGKRGKPGPPGESIKGDKGDPGLTIRDWAVEGFNVVPIMSDGSAGPVLDVRGFFDLYHREAGR